MTLCSALKTCYFTKLFNYKDRATRSEFWWWMSFNIVHCIGFVITSFIIVFAVDEATGDLLLTPIILLFSYVMLSLTSLFVRRLHDMNHSGWWIVPWYVLLIAGPSADQDELAGAGVTSAFVILCIAMLFSGTDGPNKYGPDPLAKEKVKKQQQDRPSFFDNQQCPNSEDFSHADYEDTDYMYSKHNKKTSHRQEADATFSEKGSQSQQNSHTPPHQQQSQSAADTADDTDYMFSKRKK